MGANNNLKNKVVVITGASRGLGKALAVLLASKGTKLVLSARSKNELDEVAVSLTGVDTVTVGADVTKEKEVSKIADQAVKKFGRIDIWINNAGLWLPKAPAEKIDMKRVHELMEVNLFGTMYGSREAIIQMKKQGTIVNIISTSALQGRPEQSAYSASKHAAKGFTDSIREELVDRGAYL